MQQAATGLKQCVCRLFAAAIRHLANFLRFSPQQARHGGIEQGCDMQDTTCSRCSCSTAETTVEHRTF